MPPTPDPGLDRVLAAFHVDDSARLGSGGEARVYAVDADRVLRVSHGRVPMGLVERRQLLIDELRTDGAPFLLPDVLETGEIGDRSYTVERRMPGRPVSELLVDSDGRERRELIEAHLEAAAALGSLHLEPRPWFGELIADPPRRSATWPEYLAERAAGSLAASTPEFRGIDAARLARELPDAEAPAFVHLDAFAGNMLAESGRITAVIDFGPSCVVGDARLDPLATAVYLLAPQITPAGRPEDSETVHGWLNAADLDDAYEPVRRWLAAYWAFALDDPNVLAWCRSVLLPH